MPDPRSLGRGDLLACYYTLSGAPNGQPARHSFDARVHAAARAGYAGIGMTMFDLDACTAEGRTLSDMARVAADAGVSVAEVETLAISPTPTTEERAVARRMVDAARQLNARHINVLIDRPPATPIDNDEAAAGFAEICDLVAEAGLLAAFEFMPFKAVATLDVATEIVVRAGRDNGGLVVDAYHFFRGGSRLEDVARVSGDRIVTLQMSDAPGSAPDDLLIETRTARLLPGAGGLQLEDLLRALDATGTNATVGVELLSDPLRELDADEAARASYTATRALVDRVRELETSG
ncbi:conserved hypothetical protein [Frankia canadensis]|uniref:Xylose isomerase-like TIM barrel domain-containing protein n=1 Tax=Frankia canadensis TaxID=1836972 RepID=A0A2I2KI11_9ACTN|nr:sugar phosphate isomerase/epimerase [Frankia canadensis]SNQ45269.1 conserved hypothetical protein [Frankia canadensis]SOU52559.1 conserved hypothetical protein [Frankia canadensis]